MKDRGVVGPCKRYFHKYKSSMNVTEEVKQERKKETRSN